MTSQASLMKNNSARAFRPAWHAFRHAAVGGLAVAAIAAVLLSVFVGGPFSQAAEDARIAGLKMGDVYQYFLLDQYAGVYWPVLLTVLAVVQALLAFRFLFQKSSANAWYSLGLTRTELFRTRFLAGAAGSLLPVLAAMLVALALNLANFSNVGLLLSQWLVLTAGLLTQALALYAIAALASVIVGTLLEALVHSAVLIGLPTAILVGVNALMVRFLFGNSIGAPEYRWASFDPRLMIERNEVNPLLFLYRFAQRYGSLPAGLDERPAVSALPILLWLAAALALIWLAHRLFRARRAETAGAMNASPVLAVISAFTVAFLAFSVPYMFSDYISRGWPNGMLLLISCLAAAVVGLVVVLLLRVIGRRRWKGLLALPVGLAVMLAVVGVLQTGGLGYSGYVPDASSVASVSVSYPGDPSRLPSNGYSQSGGWARYEEAETVPLALTDPADIAAIMELHRRIIRDGRPGYSTAASLADRAVFSAVRLNYKLKNGAVVTRYYPYLKTSTVAALLNLDTTKAAKAAFKAYLAGHPSDQLFIGEDLYQKGSISLSSAGFAETRAVELDSAQRTRLLDCVEQDVAALGAAERYFPADPELCVLHFYRPDEYGNDEQDQAIPTFSNDVYVTERYANTLAFLRDNGFDWALKAAGDVERVEVLEYRAIVNRSVARQYSYSPLFQGAVTTNEVVQNYKELFGGGARAFTDGSQVQQILAHSHLMYFTADDGYLVLVKYRGRDRIASAFLPAKDAPDFVKQGAK